MFAPHRIGNHPLRILGLFIALTLIASPALAALPDRASLPLRRDERPDRVLSGIMTERDNLTCRAVPFQVPAGMVRISAELDYSGRDQKTTIDMGASDPDGFRGWSGSNKASFTLSRTDATPSYLPGAIAAGTWKLNLCTAAIRPGVTTSFEARLWFWRHGEVPAVSTFSAAPLKTGPAWFRGDLHMHTAHSDGACKPTSGQGEAPCPLYRIVEAAKARGLDFIAMSDHNTGSQFNAMRELQPAFDTLLLIPAVEVTTFTGHANVWGTTEPIDWVIRPGRSANDIIHVANALHAPISINHPSSPTDESCRGCGWSAPGTDYAHVQAIEALNAGELLLPPKPGDPKRASGVDFWQARLNEGYRLTGVGGSDNHQVELGKLGAGLPTTVVHAENLSERAILDAIRDGHVFIDATGSRDKMLQLTADNGTSKAAMGDRLRLGAAMTGRFTVHIAHAKGYRLVLIEDGKPLDGIGGDLATDDETRTFMLTGDGASHWVRASVVAPTSPILIGNPIYLLPTPTK